MSAFLDGVITDGPNKGKTVRECLVFGAPHVVQVDGKWVKVASLVDSPKGEARK
jgi:hypothetical protein